MSERINIAIKFLKEKRPFLINGLRLSVDESNHVLVTGWSGSKEFKNLNKEQCLKELSEIKAVFKSMLERYPELNEIVANKSALYNLEFDDYGKASINICSEEAGFVKWHIDLK